MSEQKPELNVTLNPNGIYSPLHNILQQSSNFALLSIQLIESVDEVIPYSELKSEDTFFTYVFDSPLKSVLVTKDNYKLWIFKKAFEDLIKGINLSLIEAFNFVTIITEKDKLKTYKDFIDLQEKMRSYTQGAHIPDLLKKIKDQIPNEISFEKHILSLNKVRNCLVHRNGIVSEKDVNNKESNSLDVLIYKTKIFSIIEDKEVEIDRNHPYLVKNVQMKYETSMISFKEGEHITFNFKDFQELIGTCMFFGQDLVVKLSELMKE